MGNTHEDFSRQSPGIGPSDRNFGLVFTVAFALFGLLPLRSHAPMRPWLFALSGATLLAALIRPSVLRPANRIWTALGLSLGKVINPIVTALLFYLVFTPGAMILRMAGKDPLRLAPQPESDSYWVSRTSADEMSNMSNQF
jgi:hypothetical protein